MDKSDENVVDGILSQLGQHDDRPSVNTNDQRALLVTDIIAWMIYKVRASHLADTGSDCGMPPKAVIRSFAYEVDQILKRHGK